MTRPPLLLRISPLVVALTALVGCGEPPAETGTPTEPASPDAPPATNSAVPGTGDGKAAGGPGGRPLTEQEQAVVVDRILQQQARLQAEGLGTGRVTVNGAWNYTGYSFLSPDPNAAIEARLVAVDLTVTGHTPHFDVDDIEIVDSKSFLSYGSDPHVEFLDLEGKLMPPDEGPPSPPRANRYLLIYAYPKDTDDFRLFYWGKQLTAAPFPIADGGWEVPYPARAE